MKGLFQGIVTVFLTILIASCGGGGTSGNGTTVSVTAGITTGTAGRVVAGFANTSSAHIVTRVFVASPISITLTSVATNPAGTVPISNVLINNVTMTLTPLPYASVPANGNALSPTIPNPQYANNPQGVGGIIPGPGTLKIDGTPILGTSDGVVLLTDFLSSGLTSVEYRYTATLAYHCVEANTGAQFTVYEPIGVVVDLP